VKSRFTEKKLIRCGECDLHFHCNYLQTGVTETNVSASTSKSTYKCDSCNKLTGDTNEHSIARSNQKERLPTEIQCSASCIGDNNDSLSVQLEAVRTNGICTMELVQSLVVMVSKLSSEVQQLRIDKTLKTQLCDLQQVPSHVPST
jgi:hypothetical protein